MDDIVTLFLTNFYFNSDKPKIKIDASAKFLLLLIDPECVKLLLPLMHFLIPSENYYQNYDNVN